MPRVASQHHPGHAKHGQRHTADESDAHASRLCIGQRLYRRAMRWYVMRNRYTSSAASLLLGAVIACSSATIAEAQEPIAFIGHGVMFDAAGSSIEATPAFIESAQNFYIAKLSAQLQ